MCRRHLHGFFAGLMLCCGNILAAPIAVIDPGKPGPDLPPVGRSLFDHVTSIDGRQQVPYPFTALVAHIRQGLDAESAYLGRSVKQVLIPFGRSLQRDAAAPGFLASPRVVLAVDSDPAAADGNGMLLRDRLFIAYLEAADVLEVISYNEAAGRFEFQVVSDYRDNTAPRVRYARRVVCLACHQNAAPLFARPLWDETNANAEIARHLRAVADRHYDIPARQGSDIAYAIDNATDRANGLALTQLLWSRACGGDEPGRQCRRALLNAALQYALSGKRGYAVDDTLLDRFATQRQRHWPDGLRLPEGDIPNRRPIRSATLSAALVDADEHRTLADVAGRFEPLNPRSAMPIWNPRPTLLLDRAIAGLYEFLTRDDIRRIDARLRASGGTMTHIDTACGVTGSRADATQHVDIDCRSEGTQLRVRLTRSASGEVWQGRARRVRVAGDDLGALSVKASRTGTGFAMHFERRGDPLTVRRFNGDAIVSGSLVLNDDSAPIGQLRIDIGRDSLLIDAMSKGLLAADDAALDGRPFVRGQVVPHLVGSPEGKVDCCAGSLPFAAQVTDAASALPANTDVDAFVRVCGACHRSAEPFPPNFLHGDVEQVRAGIAQCAERIQYRLAMWDLDAAARPKSPMPPKVIGDLTERDDSSWKSRLLPRLRATLQDISGRSGQALRTDAALRARHYADLRPCLAGG